MIGEDGEISNFNNDSPESPPPCDQQTRYNATRTKIRIETDDEFASLRFSLDRRGRNDRYDEGDDDNNVGIFGAYSIQPSSGTRRAYDERPNTSGGVSRESGGYWSRDDRIRPKSSSANWGFNSQDSPRSPDARERSADNSEYRSRDERSFRETRPLYEVESGILLSGISSRSGMAFDEDERKRSSGSRDRPISPPPRPKNCCWNCQADHMITECQEPKDPKRIAMNRKNFMAAKAQRGDYGGSGGGGRAKRYHEEQSSRGAKPGEISDGLRYAMDLGPVEVPLFIYKMRIYGYPPGYLENTVEASTGLKLYGDSITMSVGSLRKDPKINPDNIISYPGYNTPMPFGEPDRGKEFGCPRYSTKDSIDNMVRQLNSKSHVSEGDGIVSQSSQLVPQWDLLSGLDHPILNDGASHGIGRGRFIEVDTLPLHLQPGRGRGNPGTRSPIFVERIDRETRPRPRQRRPIIVQEDVDERYLPQQPKATAHKRTRRCSRTPSPSLLQGDSNLLLSLIDKPVIPAKSKSNTSGRTSPVILNLPPVPTNKDATCDSDADDETGGTTASSNDFLPSSPMQKRRKELVEESESDDDVMIIPTNTNDMNSTVEYDSDCLVIDTEYESSPMKSIQNKSATQSPAVVKKVAPVNVPRPHPTPVQLHDCMADSEDWESETTTHSRAVISRPRQVPSPGSSTTGDEETFMERVGDDGQKIPIIPKPSRPSIRDKFDEDWEVGSNSSDQLIIDEEAAVVQPLQEENENNDPSDLSEGEEGSTEKTTGQEIDEDKQTSPQKPPGEFIPPNAQIEAIKDVFLAHIDQDTDGENESFTSLPAFEKFAQGMPEMTFEQDAPERIGRLDKVLEVLRTRKSAGNMLPNPNHRKT